MRRSFIAVVLGLVAATGLVGCKDSSESSGGGGGNATASKCPTAALDQADGPVELTMWHGLNAGNETALQTLVDAFNRSQTKATVRLVNQTGYSEAFQKFQAGLETGDLPDIMQGQDTRLQQFIDSGAVLPVQACIDAENYDTSDFVPRTIDYYTVEDATWALPFNVSNPVFIYNKNAFTTAGLDPDKPPATLAEIEDMARTLKASDVPTPLAIKLDPNYLEQFSAKAGEDFVNNGNGRDSRATATIFDNDVGLEVFTFFKNMVDEGLAVTNGTNGQEAQNNLLAIGNGNAAMTIDSSGVLGTAVAVLASGQYAGVDPGVSPLPGPSGDGGVLVGGAALYIVNKSSPEKQAASWEFIKFATSPEQQALLAAATGYVPVRESSTENPVLQAKWNEIPGLKVAYDQLITGANNSATAGPVIGAYQGVRDAISEAQDTLLLGGGNPKDALAQAAKNGDAAITDYNDRVGAG
jgi:sn-glycerol 3-phosphate transport system substrate-binding protein